MTSALRRPVAPRAYTTALICGGLFAFILPWLVVDLTPDYSEGAWGFSLATASLCGLRLAWIISGTVPRLFESFFLVFSYVFLGLASLVLIRTRVLASTTPYVEFIYSDRTAILVLISVVAAVTGSQFGGFFLSRRRLAASTRSLTSISAGRLQIFTVVMCISGLAYIVVFIGAIFTSRQALYQSRVSLLGDLGNAVFSAFIAMGLLVAFIGQVLYRRSGGSARFAGSAGAVALVGVILFVCVNPVSSPRFVFGTVLLAALASVGWFSSLVRFRFSVAMSIVALVFIFPASDVFRRNETDVVSIGSLDKSLQDADFDSFAQFINAVNYVDFNGITWGNQISGALLFWVPRSFWPDKPIDTGILLANFKGYQFSNLSAPLPAELYINGGIPLVVVGMFLLGFYMRRWDDAEAGSFLSLGSPTVLGCAVPFYAFIMLRGSLLQSMSFLAVLLLSAKFLTAREGESSKGATGSKKPAQVGKRRALT